MRISQPPGIGAQSLPPSKESRIPAAPVIPTVVPFADRITCTIADACAATGLGRTKLYELIGAGSLATTTIGRRRLVLVSSLLRLVEPDGMASP
jgi:excisionase family DNA binding protein